MKQIHLAAHLPGINNTTVWSDLRSGSQVEFDVVGRAELPAILCGARRGLDDGYR